MLSGAYDPRMPRRSPRHNRGAVAAPDNHRALLAAARELFAESGFHVPLSAIAKHAGVGQGVLYRHFPTRFDLAFAVFEENFIELEEASSVDDDRAFFAVWTLLLQQTITDTAFVEMIIDARRRLPAYDGDKRVRTLIQPALLRAQATGLLDPEITVDDVLAAQRMAYGLVATSLAEEWTPESLARTVARSAWIARSTRPDVAE